MSHTTVEFLKTLRAQMVAMARMIDAHLKEIEQNETTYTIGNLGVGRIQDEADWGEGLDQ